MRLHPADGRIVRLQRPAVLEAFKDNEQFTVWRQRTPGLLLDGEEEPEPVWAQGEPPWDQFGHVFEVPSANLDDRWCFHEFGSNKVACSAATLWGLFDKMTEWLEKHPG